MDSGLWVIVMLAAGAVLYLHTRTQAAGAPQEGGPVPPADPYAPVAPDTGPSPGIQALASAIATAEGYGVPGAVPTRANNPGDLKIPGWTGDVTGAEGIPIFPTSADGWNALYAQLQRIADGNSAYYWPSMTLSDMAATWTATQQSAWLTNVVNALNANGYQVTADTTIADIVYG